MVSWLNELNESELCIDSSSMKSSTKLSMLHKVCNAQLFKDGSCSRTVGRRNDISSMHSSFRNASSKNIWIFFINLPSGSLSMLSQCSTYLSPQRQITTALKCLPTRTGITRHFFLNSSSSIHPSIRPVVTFQLLSRCCTIVWKNQLGACGYVPLAGRQWVLKLFEIKVYSIILHKVRSEGICSFEIQFDSG